MVRIISTKWKDGACKYQQRKVNRHMWHVTQKGFFKGESESLSFPRPCQPQGPHGEGINTVVTTTNTTTVQQLDTTCVLAPAADDKLPSSTHLHISVFQEDVSHTDITHGHTESSAGWTHKRLCNPVGSLVPVLTTALCGVYALTLHWFSIKAQNQPNASIDRHSWKMWLTIV